ncbi:MAG: helix-turn-helix domain-containing protein [Sinobacterium sp.]|nr:helix-turn-helix domain-containing protein [Sinobacterium sp.]
MEQLNIPTRYVHSMLNLARERQCDPEEILQAIGGSLKALEESDSVPILFYGELYHAIIERLQDEWFGLLSSGNVRKGSMKFFFQSVVHCKNLQQVCERSGEFFEICHGYAVKQAFVTSGSDIIVKISKLDHLPQADYDRIMQQAPINVIKSTLLAWQGINNWLTGTKIPIKEMYYTFSESEDTSINPDTKISHQQNFCGYRISAEYLNFPIIQKEENIETFITRAPYFVFMHSPKGDLSQQIKSILAKTLGNDFPTADEVALSLHISPQTLFRRLKADNLTYLQLKNTTRAEAAIHYLNKKELTNEAISELLGFENPSTFYRAFKKWTGVSPGEYRKQLNT